MECKHGTEGPCDLCAEEDAEHDREMAIQARIDAAVAAERERTQNMRSRLEQIANWSIQGIELHRAYNKTFGPGEWHRFKNGEPPKSA